MEEAVALTAAANTIIQDADSVGNALKTVSMRIRGTTTKELEAAGEETDGLVENTSKLYSKIKALTAVNGKEGISILGEDGKFLNTYEILTKIADRWEEITKAGNDAPLLELLAGKTRGSVVAALLQQPEILKSAYEDAFNAEGSAIRENEVHLDSIQGKIDQFTNAVQTMWSNTLDDSWIKGFVELGTEIVKVIDKIGLLQSALLALGISKIVPWLLKGATGADTFGLALKTLAFGADAAALSVAKGIPAMVSFGYQMQGLTGAASQLGKGISMAWAALPGVVKIMLIAAAAIGVVVAVIDHFTISAKEAAEAATEALTTYQNAQDTLRSHKQTIESISADYKKLSKGVDEFGNNISLSTDEYERYNEVVNQIADMFPQMVTGYTDEGNAILSLKGNVEELTKAYEEEARAARDAIISKQDNVFKDFKNKTTSKDGFFKWDDNIGYADYIKVIKAYIEQEKGNTEAIINVANELGEDVFNLGVSRLKEDLGYDASSLSWEHSIESLNALLRNTQAEAKTAASSVRTILNAYLGQDFDYAKLSDKAKNIAQNIISAFDTEFYAQFDSASEMEAWITENLVKPLQNTGNLSEFELAFNFQTKFNNNEISASEYQKAIDDFLDTLQKLGFSEDIVKSVKILFNIEDLSPKIESAKELLKDDDKDKVTILTKEDLDIIDKYKSRLRIDDDTLYSWDELKQKIEELKELDTPESSITDTLSSITALENAFNSLGDAVKEFKEDGTASVSTLKSLSELFSDVDGFEELYKVLATGEGNVEEAITNVANAYIAQKNLLSDLTDEELQIMVARLESLGVINAQEILLNRQTLQQELDEKLQGYNIDLSAYSTVEQAKEAIANAATINICSAVADMETELREKYGVNLSDFVSTEEAKVVAAKKAAREIAKANKESAISNLNNDTELTERQVAEKQAEIEREYRNTISSIDSIDSNVRKVVDGVASTLDNYYNKSFKFDFSNNKIGIGRDYKDTIDKDKSSTKSDSALEKLKKEYENQISLLENQKTYIENEISRLEAEDKQVGKALYEEQIRLENEKLALYQKEREELLAQMATVAKNSDEWYEYADAVWECEHAIQESTLAVLELKDAIAQLYIDAFDKLDEVFGYEQDLHQRRIDAIEKEIELYKLRNEYATTSPEVYDKLIAEEDSFIQSLTKENAELESLLERGLNVEGNPLTDEDEYKMRITIMDNTAEIQDREINIENYKQDKRQAYLDRFNNTSDTYDNLSSIYQNNFDNAESYKKYAELLDVSVPKEILDYQIEQQNKQLQVTLNKKAELERQLAEAIASGEIVVGDSKWIEMTNKINDATKEANDFRYSIEEINQEIKSLSFDAFNDIKDAFSNVNDVFSDRQSYIEEYMNYLEALGITVPAEMYEELIANEEQRQASNMASLESLRSQLAEMEANGYTAEDDEWVQAQADIRALEKEVLASETAMAQWNKTIQEMSFEKFDEFLKRIRDVCDELENVYGLISGEDVALEDGSWTEEGIMSLGLMTQKMAIAKEQAAEYAKEIEKLEEEYQKGTMSEQDYYNRLMELKDGQWESINAYKDAKDAIIDINEARIDMIEQGIQKEIDAYTKLIDLKKKELDAERDLYNFRKDIKSQTKDIATLERKIAAMSGSTDAATIAQRSKLEAQLREARESLNDTYYDHAMDSQSNAYDDELDSYTKSKEDYVKQLREALKDVEKIVADSMAQVLVNADSVLTGLNNVSSEYGVTLSDYLMLPWQNAALQATAYKESGILDLADFTDQTGIYSGIITEQINNLFGNGSLAAGLFQTSVEGVVESVRVTVNEATSPLTSDLQLPWQTVKEYAQNTFAPEIMYALQSVADDASGKKEQLTNDLIIAFQEGVNNAEEFNQVVIDALNDVINKSDDFADVVPSNVTAPSDDPWSLWSSNVQNLIQKIIDKANDAVTAINSMNNAANNAQSIADTINSTGTSDNGGKGNSGSTKTSQPTSSYPPIGSQHTKYTEADVKALQSVLNSLFSTGLTVDGKLGPATSAAIKKAQRIMYQNGNETMKVQDGLYGVATRAAMISYIDKKIDNLRGQSGSSMMNQGIKRYTDMKKTLPKAFYAKGTMGISKDQWAITDEPQFGDELVLIPGASGNLSFMRKGTSVVPADITKRIFDLAQTPTNELGNNLVKVSIPNVSTNNNIELTFDTLLKVENATKETIPELKKLVQEQLDVFARKLNYGIKRVGQ
jgi:peptidoglycan hydrolase-like protein with peptidoglycan-binding domain/chromosome segregation ATPase